MVGVSSGAIPRLEAKRPASLEDPADRSSVSSTLLHRLAIVDRLAAHIDRHLHQPLTLDELSGIARLSKFHLHRVVLEQTGLTPAQLVGLARLRRALSILRSPGRGRRRVIEVALSVGFQDASAFSRSFRRHFGFSPREALGGAPCPVPWMLLPPASEQRAPSAELAPVRLAGFYCYGLEAYGGDGRSFVREAPQAFAATFDQVERHGVDEVLGPMARPAGERWEPPGQQRLLCAFRSSRRLALGSLTECYVPGGAYLVQRHVGPHESRWQTWCRLAVSRQRYLRGRPQGDLRRPFEAERYLCSGVPVTDVYFPV